MPYRGFPQSTAFQNFGIQPEINVEAVPPDLRWGEEILSELTLDVTDSEPRTLPRLDDQVRLVCHAGRFRIFFRATEPLFFILSFLQMVRFPWGRGPSHRGSTRQPRPKPLSIAHEVMNDRVEYRYCCVANAFEVPKHVPLGLPFRGDAFADDEQ